MNTSIQLQNTEITGYLPIPPLLGKHSSVLIYADGSCLKNGSANAQAGAGVVLMTEDRRRIKLKAEFRGH